MATLVALDQKTPGATVPGVFDFSSLFTQGQTVGALTVTVTVWAGTDPSPQSMVGTTTVAGYVVTTLFRGGVAGTIYKVVVTAVGSDESNMALIGYLAVVEDPL